LLRRLRMKQKLHLMTTAAVFGLCLACSAWTVHAQTPTAAVIDTIVIPNAHIVGLSVGPGGELAVYDRTPGVGNCLMRFFVTSLVGGVPVVTEMPETEVMVSEPPEFKGWMVRDGGLLYALATDDESTEYGLSSWDEMKVYVFSGRARVSTIVYNNTSTVTGDEPWATPEDYYYSVTGFTIKPAGAEGGNNARLIIDDSLKGNLDILDLDFTGTVLASQVRHSYRDRFRFGNDGVTVVCEWPDIDGCSTCSCDYRGLLGNGLALEWTLETRASQGDPSLAADDDLYILDPHSKTSPLDSKRFLRRFKLSHPGAPSFSAVEQAEIDLMPTPSVLVNGVEGLNEAPATDRIWIASGLQQFDEGFVPVVDTLNVSVQVIDPVYSDDHIMLVDPVDNNHVIIPISDKYAASSTLILRELQNGAVVNSVTALADYDTFSLDAAAYDRAFGLVYLAIGDTIYVVAATEAVSDSIFEDGFESGDVSKWSTSTL
jgi:hypothetical protein